MRIVKRIVLVMALGIVVGGIAGCNTVKGAGKDLQQGGQAIENAADRVGN